VWSEVANAPLSRLASAIKVGGLKNQKARRMKEILRTIKQERTICSIGICSEFFAGEFRLSDPP